METEETAPPPLDAPSPTANKPKRRQRTIRWPEGFNRKAYVALKPGKARKAYLLRFGKRHGIQPQEPAAMSPRPIVHHSKKCRYTWPKGLSRKEYFSKQPGKERQEFMANFKKTHTETEHASPKLVPQNFAWPKGMDQEEFLAKKPGTERMAYLARYIRTNGIELEERPAPPRVPIGRQPEPRAHPRCGCSSSEACASCSKCIEIHCVCGLTGRRRRALCQESRACSCSLSDPTARCKLCHGCRQPNGFSHCRCVLHQRLLWLKRHPELGMKLTEEEEENVCNCFVLAHRHGGATATKEKETKARKEMERVQRIRRATGFPSSDNIYRSNKVSTFLGEGLETDLDDGVDDGLGSEVLPPNTESVIPQTMTRRMLDAHANPASYHPLFRSEGCSLLETIEPRGGRVSRRMTAAFKSDAIQDEICRGLENISYELDRNATIPPDDLVDFLVYMASVKSANVGELIGAFEDSAAIAASIVIEEYMTQLIEDSTMEQLALCQPTEASVQAFTRELLVGFNWRLFEKQHPFLASDPMDKILSLMEKEESLKDTLTALILQEFVSTQPKHFDMKTHDEDLSRWIRSAIAILPFILTGETGRLSNTGMANITEDHATGTPIGPNEKHQSNVAGTARSTPQIRLSVKANPVHGNPAYKLHFATELEDGHHVEAYVGGLDSKIKAKATISQLSKVVERQERRSKGTLESPPKAPGPPPIVRSSPPEDPDDPYAKMFEHVRGRFSDYARQKWKASMDKYLSATMPGWKSPAQVVATKRQTTESPQRNPKKQKFASQ